MRTLEACSDPLKYCTLRPEPDWTVLGKKLGKALNTVSKAIKVRDKKGEGAWLYCMYCPGT